MRVNNHLSIIWEKKSTPLSQFPNMELFQGGKDFKTRTLILFPRLRHKRDSTAPTSNFSQYLHDKQMKTLWDDVFSPSLQAATAGVDRAGSRIFGCSYASRLALARNDLGQFITKSISVRANCLDSFVGLVRERINTTESLTDYRDFFFHTYSKDIKWSTTTATDSSNPLEQWLRSSNCFDLKRINLSDLVFDIGYSFRYVGPQATTCLWSGQRFEEAVVASGWKRPTRDLWCFTGDCYGLRGEPTVGQAAHMFSMQGYHTEKAATYKSPDSSVGTNYSLENAFLNAPTYERVMRDLQVAWEDASQRDWDARFEVRCSFFAAAEACRQGPEVVLEELLFLGCLIVIPSMLVKTFKMMHLSVRLILHCLGRFLTRLS